MLMIFAVAVRSLPSRGAWIEMLPNPLINAISDVAPLAGGVERNESVWLGRYGVTAAPLAGSEDRNGALQGKRAAAYGRSPGGERG